MFSHKNKRVFVAGHNGLAGSSLLRKLKNKDCEILTISSENLDLRDQPKVENWFKKEKPDVVYLSAATAGGIHANYSQPADFIYNNLAIQNSVIHSSHLLDIEKLCFLGSSCIYPRDCQQPMNESSFLSGSLDKHNIWYAVAKIAGIYLCDGYSKQYNLDCISVMPANLFGPGDKFTENNSHVVAALLDRFHKAKVNNLKTAEVWGTGKARREFLYVDDMADAIVFLMENYNSSEIINIGNSIDYSIKELAEMIAACVGFKGELFFDESKPDGMPRKLVDSSKLKKLGWVSKTSFQEGISKTYEWYLRQTQA
tara:strand:- start:7822 stop:8757 length:936 start_codon:yes stop_codon:yes gene_type:complete